MKRQTTTKSLSGNPSVSLFSSRTEQKQGAVSHISFTPALV